MTAEVYIHDAGCCPNACCCVLTGFHAGAVTLACRVSAWQVEFAPLRARKPSVPIGTVSIGGTTCNLENSERFKKSVWSRELSEPSFRQSSRFAVSLCWLRGTRSDVRCLMFAGWITGQGLGLRICRSCMRVQPVCATTCTYLLLRQRLDSRIRPRRISLSGNRWSSHEEYSGRHATLDLA